MTTLETRRALLNQEDAPQTVHFLRGVPKGYLHALRAHGRALWGNMRQIEGAAKVVSPETSIREQEARWLESTGLQPVESKFTLIIPIHNEETFLISALNSLFLSDIPPSVLMNIVLVTNNCSDESVALVRTFMQSIGNPQEFRWADDQKDSLGDDGVAEQYSQTMYGNWNIIHVDTRTPGKANALTIGNNMARQADHPVALSMDANNFVEPTSISKLFAAAWSTIVQDPDGTAVLDGSPSSVNKIRISRAILERLKKSSEKAAFNHSGLLHGWLMAWDTDFIKSIGGIPRTATEDYALGVVVREKGRRITNVSDARIWGFEAGHFAERIEQYSRSVRGYLQLIDKYPYCRDIAELDRPYYGTLKERVRFLLSRLQDRPKSAPIILLKFLMIEGALKKGKRDYRRNPDSITWTPITSTKKKI